MNILNGLICYENDVQGVTVDLKKKIYIYYYSLIATDYYKLFYTLDSGNDDAKICENYGTSFFIILFIYFLI